MDRGWIAEADSRYRPVGIWTVWTPVLPDPASPLGKQFEGIHQRKFEEQVAFGKDWFTNHLIPEVLKLIPVRYVDVLFGPGARGGDVIPTMNMTVQGGKAAVDAVAAALGYVGQLPWVQTFKDSTVPDGMLALDLVQVSRPAWSASEAGKYAGAVLKQCPKLRAGNLGYLDGDLCMRFLDRSDSCEVADIHTFIREADAGGRSSGVSLVCDWLFVPA